MKELFKSLLLQLILLVPVSGAAQQSNDTLNAKLNFSRSWLPLAPYKDPSQVISLSRQTSEVSQTTDYYDGFGRPIQSVIKRISPLGNDHVSLNVHDSAGRERYKYLPYTAPSATGDLKLNPLTEQGAFYNNMFPGEQTPYTQTLYDASPLNRGVKKMAPGNSWGFAGRGTNYAEGINTVADSVRIWTTANDAAPVTPQAYSAGELYKQVQTDENNNQVVTFTNREGQTILTKVQLKSSPGSGHTGWLCTYYVYDDMGHLCFVIPPLVVERINGNWNINNVLNFCTQYRHDARGRIIVKKTPDTDSSEFVYDIRDRLVFTRDGGLKAQNKWYITLYDERDRSIMTGFYTTFDTRQQLQSGLNSQTTDQVISYTDPPVADLVTAIHDTSLYVATNSITLLCGFNSGGAELTATIDPSMNGDTITVIANTPLLGLNPGSLTPLSYTFYDNYNFEGAQPALQTDLSKPQAGGDGSAEANTVISKIPKGLITGEKVRVPGTDQWLTSTFYYNDKGRTIQTIEDNFSGGSNITTCLYNFNGRLLSTYLRHKNRRSSLTPQTTLLTNFTFDAGGRLLTVTKQINDDGNNKMIVRHRYDESGELKTKVLGTNIDSLEYEQNIRGWLKNINKGYAVNGNAEGKNHHFGEQLYYDSTYTAQYTGNISGVRWRGYSDDAYRSYGFGYDVANRLLKADFTQYDGGWNTSGGIDYSMKMGDGTNADSAYDANGNILRMEQKGFKPGGSITIDNLRYTYQSNSNKLQGVIDLANDPTSILGDFKETTGAGNNDYSYDVNGNFTKDANKYITNISYNYLNHPEVIRISGRGTVQYQYDARGRKLRKTVIDSTVTPARTIITDYIDGFVYQNDSLQFFTHEEGRVRMIYKTNTPLARTYDYFIKDHLGNIRTVLTEQGDLSPYAATMETGSAAIENALFSNIDNTRSPLPSGYPVDNTTSPNNYLAKLNAVSGRKIGPSLVLRVMAGDTIQLGAKTFYKSTAANTSGTNTSSMLTALLQAFSDIGVRDGGHIATGATSPIATSFTASNYDALKQKDPSQNLSNKPKAYLNYVLFDDRFNMVDENSGVRQVQGNPDELQTLATDRITIKKTGFIYIYTSNESAEDVFFDNLIVTHSNGPLLAETHYYPFGLVMDGISSRALLRQGNRYLYQGKEIQSDEFTDGTGLHWYDFGARYYDPQLGRWFSTDPAGQDFSPYMAMGNRPTVVVDPDGRFWHIVIGGIIGGGVNLFTQISQGNVHGFTDGLMAFGIGFAAGALSTVSGGAAYGAMTGVGVQAGIMGSVTFGAGGFAAGAVSSAVGSGVGGFVGGTFNAKTFYGAGSWGDAMAQGAREGASGMVIGGITGGIVNGIGANINGRNFWNGNLKLYDINPVLTTPSAPIRLSDDAMKIAKVQGFVSVEYDGGYVYPTPYTADAGRVFWSSGRNPLVAVAAQDFAVNNGMTTLGMTRAGQNMINLTKDMSSIVKDPMWIRLSSQFAKGAHGTVHVFQNSSGIGIKSIWSTVEYPILKQKGVNIIYHIID